jgi:hypothetical protein
MGHSVVNRCIGSGSSSVLDVPKRRGVASWLSGNTLDVGLKLLGFLE